MNEMELDETWEKLKEAEELVTHKIHAWGITEALASGMDQASVMRIAGHASPQTMRHYVRTARIKKDIEEKFDSVFN